MDELTFRQAGSGASGEQLAAQSHGDEAADIAARRMFAFVADTVVGYLATFALTSALFIVAINSSQTFNRNSSVMAFTSVLFAVYLLVAMGRAARAGRRLNGRTLGQRLTGLRLADTVGGRIQAGRAAAHAVFPAIVGSVALSQQVVYQGLGASHPSVRAVPAVIAALVFVIMCSVLLDRDARTFYDRLLGVRAIRAQRTHSRSSARATTPQMAA